MKTLLIILCIAGFLSVIGWLGLQIKPKPFDAFAGKTHELSSIPVPTELPAPVDRFYRAYYGDSIPVIETAVISGRGSMRLGGVNVPIRFRFTHEVGESYRHDIGMTFFGIPVLKGYDTYIDGHGLGKTPGGIDQGPGFDQGSNISLWAEALNWFPAVLLTDPRVSWKPVDDQTALLVVPFGNERDVMVVRFDPETNLIQHTEAMKFKLKAGKKVLWINGTWSDEGIPWIRLNVEDTVFNVEVHDYIREPLP